MRSEKELLGEWIGIGKGASREVLIAVLIRKRNIRRDAVHRLGAPPTAPYIQEHDRAPGRLVVVPTDGHDLLTARDSAAGTHSRRLVDVQLVDVIDTPAVGTHRPQVLNTAQVLVEVFPASIDHSAVVQHGWNSLTDRILRQPPHVLAISVHHVECCDYIARCAEDDPLRARAREHDLAARQITRIHIVEPAPHPVVHLAAADLVLLRVTTGQLVQAARDHPSFGRVDVDLIDTE